MSRPIALAVALATLALSGCSIAPNSNVLPGSVATGSDGYRVKAEFTTVGNLVPNSEIRYNNVAVGTVLSIHATKAWSAQATLSIRKDIKLPANVHATIGQKSLLGAEYVELVDPTTPDGRLRAGDSISTAVTGNYPGTEEVLSAVSLLLNNGGLSQIQTISRELNNAMQGRTETTRDLIAEIAAFSGALDHQKSDIVGSLDAMNRLSGKFAAEDKTVARAIDHIGPGVKSVNANRKQLEIAINKIGRFGDVATTVVNESGNALVSDLQQLEPILDGLRKAGVALPQATRLLTFPFPLEHVDRVVRGDYANLFITLDVTAGTIINDFGLLKGVPSVGAANPLTAPLTGQQPVTERAPSGQIPSPAGSQPSTTPAGPSGSSVPSPGTGCGLLSSLLGGC